MGKFSNLRDQVQAELDKANEYEAAGQQATDPKEKAEYAKMACGAQARADELRAQQDKGRDDGQSEDGPDQKPNKPDGGGEENTRGDRSKATEDRIHAAQQMERNRGR